MHAVDQSVLDGRSGTARYRGKRPLRHMIPALLAGSLLCAPAVVHAAPACSASVNGALDFGTYDVYSPVAPTATARLRLTCPKGLTPQVTISSGNSGAFDWRELRSGTDALRYNVFLDAAMTVVWGDGTGGSSAFTSATGNAQLTLYARVPAGQDATAGAYSDVLVVTVFL